MMTKHLTEKEIQEYALNPEGCNAETVQHVRLCEECLLRVNGYQLLFRTISEQPHPQFDFNLTELVFERLQPKKQSVKSYWMLYVVLLPCIVLTGIGIFIFHEYLLNVYFGVASMVQYLIITAVSTMFLILSIDMYKRFQKKIHSLDIY